MGLRHDYLCVSPAPTSLTQTLDPSLTGNGHFALPISLRTPPPPPNTSTSSSSPFTHREQVTDYFQHLESDEAITLSPLVTSSGPCVARPLLVFEVDLSLLSLLFRGGGRRVGVIPPTAASPRHSCLSTADIVQHSTYRLIRRGVASSFGTAAALSALSGWHCVSDPSPLRPALTGHLLQRRQEDGGGVCWSCRGHASVCSSHSGFIK